MLSFRCPATMMTTEAVSALRVVFWTRAAARPKYADMTAPSSLKIALAQLNPVVGDLDGNAKRAAEAHARAKARAPTSSSSPSSSSTAIRRRIWS